jgi:hypothetical protein
LRGRTRAGHPHPTAADIVLAVLTAAAASLSIPFGPASAATELEVTIGVNGRFEPNDSIIVHAQVTAGELIDGEIVTTADTIETTVRQTIEVPAGTTKDFYLLVPSAWDRARVEVSIRDGGDEVASAVGTARMADGELVGVLPRLASRIGELPDDDVPLGAELGDAVIGTLVPEVIDLGPAALRGYDSIVAGDDDLAELSEDQREALWAWVSTGGTLLLDDEAANADLPEDWRVGDAGYAWADLGEIRLTDGAATAGRWADVIPPTVPGNSPGAFFGTEMMFGPDGPNSDLAARAGLDLPTIAPLAIGLAVYGFVLGPVIYLVLRRLRRLTLGWLVIPGLAVVTAGGVALAGGGALRSGDPAATVFLQNTVAGRSYAVSNVLTFSSSGGSAELDIPAGWALQGTTFFWGDGSMIPITITRNGNGTSAASVELEATQANVRTYAGTTTGVGLTTTAEVDGGHIVGTVTNNTDHAFTDVAVFAGAGQAKVGELAPGETADWQIGTPRDLRFSWDSRGARVWGDPWNERGEFQVGEGLNAEWGMWGIASMDLDLFPTGMVRVVGWTDGIGSTLLDAGDSTVTGASTVVSIDSGSRVNAATVRVAAVRGPFGFAVAPANEMVIRYLLPPGTAPGDLFLTGADDVDVDEISFWDGEQWIASDATLDAIPVPEQAVRDGTLLVLTDVNPNTGVTGLPTLTDEAPS